MWVRQNPLLYEVFQINQASDVKKSEQRKSICLEGLGKRKSIRKTIAPKRRKESLRFGSLERKTFDSTQSKPVHRRVQSSFANKRNEKFSVIVDSKIVSKQEILLLKSKFDEIAASGTCEFKKIYATLISLGYRVPKNIDPCSEDTFNFHELIQLLFQKASQNQIARIMNFVGHKVQVIVEESPKPPPKNVIDAKMFAMYRKMFEKYDKNHDGIIDLKELKLALKETLTEETIENLYSMYRQQMNGLSLKKFIRLYVNDDVEVPETMS